MSPKESFSQPNGINTWEQHPFLSRTGAIDPYLSTDFIEVWNELSKIYGVIIDGYDVDWYHEHDLLTYTFETGLCIFVDKQGYVLNQISL